MKKTVLILSLIFSIKFFSQTTVPFTTPGTTNWTVPACVTEITVEVWGAGGGGGAAWSRAKASFSDPSEACSCAGGGGGGGYARRVYTVTPGDIYTIVVGAGGAGGTGNNANTSNALNNGIAGGNSSFSGPATISVGASLIAAGGGFGGGAYIYNNQGGNHQGTNGIAGNGGAGSGGTTNFNGGNGSSGRHSGSCYDVGGAGGGGASSSGAGGNASAPASCTLRTGGAGSAPGGNGANGVKYNSYSLNYEGFNGLNGLTIGGGGSGACQHCNSSGNEGTIRVRSGGAGARGEVRITHSGAIPPVLAISPAACNTNSTSVNLSATASSTNSPTYAWTTSGGTINSGSTGLTPNVKGPGTFTLVAYNGVSTCSASALITLTNVDCNLLSADLTDFNAVKEKESITLNWQTNSEVNNDYFVIEKSADGLNFESIDVVKGAGTTNRKINYQSTDKNLSSGIIYYRLKQVDFDGKSSYSKTVSIEGVDKEYNVGNPLPNPTSAELSIEFNVKTNSDFIVEIIDVTGKKVKTFTELIETGFSSKNFNIVDLESGLYFLQIKSTDGKYFSNHKIIKH